MPAALRTVRSRPRRLAQVVAFLTLCGLLVSAGFAEASGNRRHGPHSGTRPNILLFISDDHGWPDYGFQGHPFVQTPNIDRLADEGVVFSNGYAQASVCLPALKTLISGLPSAVWSELADELEEVHGPIPLRRESQYIPIMLPRMLRQAGYRSFAGGKMWEGSFEDAGFDAGTMQTVPVLGVDGSFDFGRDSMETLFSWVEDQTEPWFAWVAPMLPHTPHDPPAELIELYEDVDISPEARRYYANLTRLDARLGETLAFLEETGRLDDTVVIYLADNGWEQRLEGVTPLSNVLGDDRGKGSLFDRGFRTPIIVRWPREMRAGRTQKEIVDFEDVYATILDYAGVETHACTVGTSFRRERRAFSRRKRAGRFFRAQDTIRVPFAEVEPGFIPISNEPGRFLRAANFAYTHYPERDEEFVYALWRDPDALNDISGELPWLTSILRFVADIEESRLNDRHCPVSSIEAEPAAEPRHGRRGYPLRRSTSRRR